MFGMVVLFGLFHGLFFIPVVLSIIGPVYTEQREEKEQENPPKVSSASDKNIEQKSPDTTLETISEKSGATQNGHVEATREEKLW